MVHRLSRHPRRIAFTLAYLLTLSGTAAWAAEIKRGGFAGYAPDYRPAYHYPLHRPASPLGGGTFHGTAAPPAAVHRAAAAGMQHRAPGGPGQPETGSFRPVGADNMVDLFSGDFSYNIPLLDVGGYPVNIFYNSGITMDQEASWVGLGWNVNPGSVTRNMRGLPDDFNGTDKIKKTQFVRPDRTWGVSVGAGFEFFGGAFDLNANAGIFVNNKRGVGLELGVAPSIGLGKASADDKTRPLNFGYSLNFNSQSGASQSFSMSLKFAEQNGWKGSFGGTLGYNSRVGLQSLHLDAEFKKNIMFDKNATAMRSISDGFQTKTTLSSNISFAYPAITPTIRNRFATENWSLDLGAGADFFGANPHLRLGGYYTRTRLLDNETIAPAFGYLYMQEGQDNPQALLDFNRLQDAPYTPNAPTIAIPAYTYDIFQVSGEGTGGSFRAYRGDLGFVNDPTMESVSESGHLGIELGGGGYGKGAINAQYAETPTSSGKWNQGNLAQNALRFRRNSGGDQAVYFKNPGEKAIPDAGFQSAIGGEDMVRLKMTNLGVGAPIVAPTLVRYGDDRMRLQGEPTLPATLKRARDKRTQVISFLTAQEAARGGFDPQIRWINQADFASTQTYYGCGLGSRLQSAPRFGVTDEGKTRLDHISEVDVLGSDGRRYVYGIPVYNLKQVDITFNKGGNAQTAQTQKIGYNGQDTTDGNTEGKDYFVEKQELPPYAHSFLLTGLLSPNYVDRTGDGITEDDAGDAVKFNYAKMDKALIWRTPADPNQATFSEGLKTDRNDDKAHIVYGEREQWYLYSIESKNMVARFYATPLREDARALLGANGGIDVNNGAYRLTKISLFTKAELTQTAHTPRPVKTVNFEYDYSLCGNYPLNTGRMVDKDGQPTTSNTANVNAAKGKLTLRSIYFTYNGNNKNRKNYYRFNYPTDANRNPGYDYTANDRWGNYKNKNMGNPAGLQNADYPYVSLDKSVADQQAAAWTLNQVVLPSGGTINVDYESDDYAFVQDRRASAMLTVAGFGSSVGEAPGNNRLYQSASSDNDYIFIEVPKAIRVDNPYNASKVRQLIHDWYLPWVNEADNKRQLFLRLSVQMPNGSEFVPVYADIDDWGLVTANTTNRLIWIRVRRLDSGYTPMVQHSLQFLKNYLPAQAYPGYDVSEDGGLRAIVRALAGMFRAMKETFRKDMKLFMDENKAKRADLAKTFIRLSDPYLAKPGGGLRVKRITITDNFDKMTAHGGAANPMPAATYGQEYIYKKQELVNGEQMTISSGVASWEPAIGGEENPHREILSYFNRNKMGPYDYSAVELPLAEMFYPSPSVGYSRVEVRSINRTDVKNPPSRQVSEYYTAREFPTRSNYTPLEEAGATDKYEPNPILSLLKIDINTAVSLSQGFKVDLNDMHGKIRRQAVYGPDTTLADPVSQSEYFYNTRQKTGNTYAFNHNFPVLKGSDGFVTDNALIGRDVEMMTDFRAHRGETITTNLNFNLDVVAGALIPIPVPTFFSPVSYQSNTYRAASVLKVVNHYGMVDSVRVIDKGSMVSTHNLVYDAETGNPLLTSTQNEFNMPVYNFSYPAHWAYTGMGPAYRNIDAAFSNLTFVNGKVTGGIDPSLLESGDELLIISATGNAVAPATPCDYGSIMSPWLPMIAPSYATKIWAINTVKSGNLVGEWYFIDKEGKPYTASGVNARIIRSGKRNLLDATVGSVVSLADPRRPQPNGLKKVVFDDATQILQSTSASYKDHWRVDNALFFFDSSFVQTLYGRVKRISYPVQRVVQGSFVNSYSGSNNFWLQDNPTAFDVRHMATRGTGHTTNQIEDVWLMFNIPTNNPVASGGTLYASRLGLSGHWAQNHPYLHDPNYWQYRVGGLNNDLSIIPMRNTPNLLTGPLDPGTWRNYFLDPFGIYHDRARQAGYVPPTNDHDTRHYVLQYNGQTGTSTDNRVVIANDPARRMLLHTDGYNGALRVMRTRGAFLDMISVGKRSTQDAVQCFNNYNSTPWLDVYYYNCGDTSYSTVPVGTTGNGSTQRPAMYVPDPLLNIMVACGVTTGHVQECRSKFTRLKTINPYVEGVWGNWRVDSSFVYYGNRKESQVGPIDMRTAGTISGYKSFWLTASDNLQRNYPASDVWSWTSTITQYNRRGYEIENKDPLGRFNAGLYGYSQQLPIAVVNNSRYRESLFDGFEDYTYQNGACGELCKPPRHFNIKDAAQNVVTTEHHSGRYSLQVASYQSAVLVAPVADLGVEKPYGVRTHVDSVLLSSYTTVSPRGSGLRATYLRFNDNCNLDSTNWSGQTANYSSCASDVLANPGNANGQFVQYDNNFSFSVLNNPNAANAPGVPWANFFAARWEGFVQATEDGYYRFLVQADDGVRLWINNVPQLPSFLWSSTQMPRSRVVTVYLQKGVLTPIRLDYFKGWGGYQPSSGRVLSLLWAKPGTTLYQPIPANQLYPIDRQQDGNGTVTTVNTYCTRFDFAQVAGQALTDTFSPGQNRKMLLSAWVKEGGQDCKCVTYTGNSISVTFPGTNGSQLAPFRPAGSIIEGWQRYEAEFTIPQGATSLQVNLSNGSNRPVYFDDLRIHPFNANLKSFVYDPTTLRLMAEGDENNYATFYEYDDDGTLVRVKKETVRGVKTITETRNALQKAIQ